MYKKYKTMITNLLIALPSDVMCTFKICIPVGSIGYILGISTSKNGYPIYEIFYQRTLFYLCYFHCSLVRNLHNLFF